MYQAHVRYLICKSIKTKKEIIESKDSVCVFVLSENGIGK